MQTSAEDRKRPEVMEVEYEKARNEAIGRYQASQATSKATVRYCNVLSEAMVRASETAKRVLTPYYVEANKRSTQEA